MPFEDCNLSRVEKMNTNLKQLWKATDEEYQLVLYAHSSGVYTRSFPKVRVLFWPNNKPCWPVNMYIIGQLRRGRTIGTVNSYAAQLAFLLRFLYEQNMEFEDITDESLYDISQWLSDEPDKRKPKFKRRGGRQVNKILRQTLTFLEWYQSLFRIEEPMVGAFGNGAKITVEVRELRIKGSLKSYLWHESMVAEEVPRDVKPMARDVYLKLLGACQHISKSQFVQSRASILLKLLHDTGARRIEISRLQVKDVMNARESSDGKLSLHTAKQRANRIRQVPLPVPTLNAAINYIEVQRKMHVWRLKKQKVIDHDPGWLFLTNRGKALNVETISQDISRLRHIAGIKEPATAHMLRHRWITIQVIHRLKSYLGKKLPMDVATTILTRVASMTGHKQIESLWIYIDLAFEEMGVWDTAETIINMRLNAEAAHRELLEIRDKHADGSSLTKKELCLVDTLLRNLLDDVKPEFMDLANCELSDEITTEAYSERNLS